MDDTDEENDFRVFANRSGPVVTDHNRRRVQYRAPRWNPEMRRGRRSFESTGSANSG